MNRVRLVNFSSLINDSLSKHSTVVSIQKVKEPKEYRTMYITNLHPDWKKEDIIERMNKLGSVKDCHLIKTSLGEFTGKAFITYDNIKSVELSLEKANWKIPFEDPVKATFYRAVKYPTNQLFNKKVLVIKHIPKELLKKDLFEYINTYSKCLHISYPRTWDDEFLKMAYIYFYTEEDAELVFNKLHLRYVMNKQLIVTYAENYYDISDFRYLIENKVKLDTISNNYLNTIHRQFLIEYISKLNPIVKHYEQLVKNELEKISYYNARCGYDINKDIEMLEYEKLKVKRIISQKSQLLNDNEMKEIEYKI